MNLPNSAHFKVLVSKEMHQLLQLHECVIIPGLGGIIGNYSPAYQNKGDFSFAPANKQLIFNRNLVKNDGLLIAKMSEHNGFSYDETRNLLDAFVLETLAALNNFENVTLPNVGTFYLDTHKILRFTQDLKVNYLPSSYGLFSFTAAPINRTPIVERREETVLENRGLVPPVKVSNRFPLTRVLQTLPLLALAAFIAINVSLPAGRGVSLADLNPFPAAPMAKGKMHIATTKPHSFRKALEITDNNTASFSAENARIFIVAGCFATRTNADGMVNHLSDKGFDAKILDQTPAGHYRVVYGNYPDITSANEEMNAIKRGMNEEAWLLVL
jgi:hypothetical protein